MHQFVITRRHRFFALALALIAAGTFFVLVLQGSLIGAPMERFRTCTESELYSDLPFGGLTKKYHYAMEQLTEERMQIYEGKYLLQCDATHLDAMIPYGPIAGAFANELPDVPDPPRFTYRHFELLMHEMWRTYDCHLHSVGPVAFGTYTSSEVVKQMIDRERVRARNTFDRLMMSIRSSEQYLPLHASLRCLQRGASDVRNATALLADTAQCIPVRLSESETSIRTLP